MKQSYFCKKHSIEKRGYNLCRDCIVMMSLEASLELKKRRLNE